MNLLITFVLLYVAIYVFYSNADKIWLRALIISAVLIMATAAVVQFGMLGWVVAMVAVLFVIMKVMNTSLGSAFLLLLVLGILQQLVAGGVEKYI